MKLRHICALIIMQLEEFFNRTELIGIVYWWVCDVLFLGFLGKSLGIHGATPLFAIIMIISVVTMRPTAVRGPVLMARFIIKALAGHMFMSNFATPMTHREWIVGGMITTFLQAVMRLCLGYTLIYLFFGINVFNIGWALFATIPFFIISGWVIGWFTSALVYLVGKQCLPLVQCLSFTFMALCGVISPVSALPQVLQHVAWALPITYILTGLREHILTGIPLWPFLLKNLMLNVLYAFVTLPLLYFAFRYAKQRGLARLENM